MPTLVSGGTFQNNWKNILDKLRNILRNEFKGALPVYIGKDGSEGTQFIRLSPIGISVVYYFAEHNLKKTALDHVLRYTSRIEALIHDNIAMTLADNTEAFNCRLETTELNPDEESGTYVVQWEYKCQHLGNTG